MTAVLVGRDGEVAVLDGTLDRLRGGAGSVLQVADEPAIGVVLEALETLRRTLGVRSVVGPG